MPLSTAGIVQSLIGWYSTAFGAVFFILWLIGDAAQLGGLYLSGTGSQTEIALNYTIGVLETLMLLLLLFYAGKLGYQPESYKIKVAEDEEEAVKNRRRGVGATLVRSHTAFLRDTAFLRERGEPPGIFFDKLYKDQDEDAAGPPGTASMPPYHNSLEGSKSSAPIGLWQRLVLFWARWELPIVLLTGVCGATVVWYLKSFRHRATENDEHSAVLPETMEEKIAIFLLSIVFPRLLNIVRSYKRKQPEGITVYGIFTMGNAHLFNIINATIFNWRPQAFAAKSPYILNSVFCLILDLIRFYLKHRYRNYDPEADRHPLYAETNAEFWEKHDRHLGEAPPTFKSTQAYLKNRPTRRRDKMMDSGSSAHDYSSPESHSPSDSGSESDASDPSSLTHEQLRAKRLFLSKLRTKYPKIYSRIDTLNSRRAQAVQREEEFKHEYEQAGFPLHVDRIHLSGTQRILYPKFLRQAEALDQHESEDLSCFRQLRSKIDQVQKTMEENDKWNLQGKKDWEALEEHYWRLRREDQELDELRKERHERFKTLPDGVGESGIEFKKPSIGSLRDPRRPRSVARE
ncbi:hypothetical protein JCM11641_007430 [Rhodosporidiobolus odoratus]